MEKAHKVILEPFAQLVSQMEFRILRSTDDELRGMVAACDAVTDGNCSYLIYEARKIVHDLARSELYRRERARQANPG